MPDFRAVIRDRFAELSLSPAREVELIEELSQHLQDEYERAVSRGASESEATESVLHNLDFESLKHELKRVERRVSQEPPVMGDGRRINLIRDVGQDLRYALRLLIKSPSFTIVTILALALGIGANTAIFTVVNTVLIRPLPYPDSGRLVELWENNPAKSVADSPFSPPKLADLQDQQKSFTNVGGYYGEDLSLPLADRAESISAARTMGDFFKTMDAAPLLGRLFTAAENQFGGPRAVLLSYSLWQTHFDADRSVIGRQIILSKESYTVIGIMPENFRFPSKAQIWIPAAFPPAMFTAELNRTSRFVVGLARLKTGVGLDQAQAEMTLLSKRLGRQFPPTEGGWKVHVGSLQDQIVERSRNGLLILFAAVGVVLLIACANVANLQMARAEGRRKEIALRAALGASRGRLVRQFLIESLTLSLIGGALGALVATWGVRLLLAASAGQIPRAQEIHPDLPVFLFTIALTTVTGLLFGVGPALSASRTDLDAVLRETGPKLSGGLRGSRSRSVLLVSQIAFALVLLIGATLLIESLRNVERIDPGFQHTHVLTMKVSLPWERVQQAPAFFGRVLERLAELPGVTADGATSFLPLSGLSTPMAFNIVGQSQAAEARLLSAFQIVTPGYFKAIGIPLQKGRTFDAHDTATSPLVILVNEAFVSRYFPRIDPIGQVLRFNAGTARAADLRIVGVVGSTHQAGLDEAPAPEIFSPHTQSTWPAMALVLRTTAAPSALIPTVQRALFALDPTLPAFDVKTMDERLDDSVAQRRFHMVLLGLFATIALLLAAIGVYGMIAYGVSRRTQEIGIRLALGAQRSDVLQLIVGQGLRLTIIGIGAGLAVAFAARRLIASLVFGVTVADPITFAGASVLLGAIALLACWLPARRASRVDPVVALHAE